MRQLHDLKAGLSGGLVDCHVARREPKRPGAQQDCPKKPGEERDGRSIIRQGPRGLGELRRQDWVSVYWDEVSRMTCTVDVEASVVGL